MQNHDAGEAEFRAAEQAHRDLVDRFNEATHCESCGAPLGDCRHEIDGYIIGNCCAVPLAEMALDNLNARSFAAGAWA